MPAELGTARLWPQGRGLGSGLLRGKATARDTGSRPSSVSASVSPLAESRSLRPPPEHPFSASFLGLLIRVSALLLFRDSTRLTLDRLF